MQDKFKHGEKGFAVFWLIFGLFFFWQSWLMYQDAPSASSHGALPLFVSGLIVILSIAILISDRKKDSEGRGQSAGEVIRQTLKKMMPKDVLVMMALIVIYCAALFAGLGFYIATPVFLWVSMSYLMRKDYVKNLLWTALCMAFIYVVFSTLFSVVLP